MSSTERLIWENNLVKVVAHPRPHVSREEGGHVKISPKEPVGDCSQLDPKLAIEVMRISMVAGEAMRSVLGRKGIILKRINYQDNGNWAVMFGRDNVMHLHLYGRTGKEEKQAAYPSSLYFPDPSDENYYKDFIPLTKEDCSEIGNEMEKILEQEKYLPQKWRL